ncbi:MAG: hypothetical protein ACR2ND_06760, partial [Solirubrobacteraceae bacterium]
SARSTPLSCPSRPRRRRSSSRPSEIIHSHTAAAKFHDGRDNLGIGPKTAQRLGALGLRTLAAVREADAAALREVFGENLARHLQARARFEDDTPLRPVRETKSQSSERTFDCDMADRGEQERVLDELSAELCRRLEGRGLAGRTVAIKIRLDDWTTVTRARTLERPTRDPACVIPVARALLRSYAPARPVRLLGVRIAGFEPEGQLALTL